MTNNPAMGQAMTDRASIWFPISAVDTAVTTPHGSGRSEKALMTWFAARPIAQARAAMLTAVLPTDREDVQQLIEIAITAEAGVIDRRAVTFADSIKQLSAMVADMYPDGLLMLDPFSGRGIIPLEAGRFGMRSVGIDLAPLAVLASRLLAQYPQTDWSHEPRLPDNWYDDRMGDGRPKLVQDVEAFLNRVGLTLLELAEPYYSRNPNGSYPWGYLWAVTIPCDGCGRRFPLVGSLVLRQPRTTNSDPGQWLRLKPTGDTYTCVVEEGVPPETAQTFVSVSGQRGRVGRCLFCRHVHSLDVVKRKGFGGEYKDAILIAAETGQRNGPSKIFRQLRPEEVEAALRAESADLEEVDGLSAIPDEEIPAGNNDTVRASGYGYQTYGSIMTRRQAIQFALTVKAIRQTRQEVIAEGLSESFANALTSYAGATLGRRVRWSTRGAHLRSHGSAKGASSNTVQVEHIYAGESKVSDGFDFFETGPSEGPGTWSSIATTEVKALAKAIEWPVSETPGRFRAGSATALPLRDNSVQTVITDPPYYNMIDYSDASDVLYVWVKRALADSEPDLFGAQSPHLQPKDEEIIVKRGGTEEEHRTADFYHEKLAQAFSEIRRVLVPGGSLTVIFGHHDPEAWVRLLAALHRAGFVVTAAWPSRTESANTGVASVKVTVSIVCRVADDDRPTGLVADVDRDVRKAVESRVAEWNRQGLAQPDQNMAAYGPAMEAYGAHSRVVFPSGEEVVIERYLILARKVVREQLSMKVDQHPLDAFDAATRLAIYWLRYYGQEPLAKGEARYNAQTEGVRLEEVRAIFKESRKGFSLSVEPTPVDVVTGAPLYLMVLGLAYEWRDQGAEGVAGLLAKASHLGIVESPTDARLWAIIGDVPQYLNDSEPLARGLAAIQRSKNQLTALAHQAEPSSDGGEQSALKLGVPS